AAILSPMRVNSSNHAVSSLATFERAADAMHLVDFDSGPGSSAEGNKQAHGPAVVARKIEEGGVVFAADHILLPVSHLAARVAIACCSSSDDWIIRLFWVGAGSGAARPTPPLRREWSLAASAAAPSC